MFLAASELADLSLLPMPAGRSPLDRLPHRGPGWFDSSWELHSGCEVREGLPADSTLREWIEAWLCPRVEMSSAS